MNAKRNSRRRRLRLPTLFRAKSAEREPLAKLAKRQFSAKRTQYGSAYQFEMRAKKHSGRVLDTSSPGLNQSPNAQPRGERPIQTQLMIEDSFELSTGP
jgi:hypothetical protein